MCGIIGVASTEGMKNRSNRLQFMKMGLDIDSWRGWESTGLALVPSSLKEDPIVYKRALNGRDFIQLNQVDKYLSDIEKYPVALGHNRAATTGRGNIVDHNAHPFQYGRITLVHNGHIRNTHDLKGAMEGAQCQVDSAQVAWAMNANGEKETLEQIDGGFVLVWWNSETNILNIARNTERPLHMAFADGENTFYWASEFTELLHLLKDVKIDEDIGVLYPQAHNWYKFNLKDLREFERTPFTKRQGRRSQTSGRVHGTGAIGGGTDLLTDAALAEWEQYENRSTTSTAHITQTGTTSSSDEIEEIREDISNQREKDSRLAGVPTSRKRIARAKQELHKLGIRYEELRNCVPISWAKYRNQQHLGSIIAKTTREGHPIEVLHIRDDEYKEYKNAKHLLVDCVNVRRGANNDFRLIGVISPRMKAYMLRQAEAKKIEEGAIQRNYNGPNGTKITLDRFKELTKIGCVHCRCDIEPKQHESIVWVGRDDNPLCIDCSGDSDVMELIGFPEHVRNAVAVH